MKVLSPFALFKRDKLSKHDKKIMEEFESGKVLQVDNGIDNKEYLRKKENE